MLVPLGDAVACMHDDSISTWGHNVSHIRSPKMDSYWPSRWPGSSWSPCQTTMWWSGWSPRAIRRNSGLLFAFQGHGWGSWLWTVPPRSPSSGRSGWDLSPRSGSPCQTKKFLIIAAHCTFSTIKQPALVLPLVLDDYHPHPLEWISSSVSSSRLNIIHCHYTRIFWMLIRVSAMVVCLHWFVYCLCFYRLWAHITYDITTVKTAAPILVHWHLLCPCMISDSSWTSFLDFYHLAPPAPSVILHLSLVLPLLSFLERRNLHWFTFLLSRSSTNATKSY
jgi:hypothetical protein